MNFWLTKNEFMNIVDELKINDKVSELVFHQCCIYIVDEYKDDGVQPIGQFR